MRKWIFLLTTLLSLSLTNVARCEYDVVLNILIKEATKGLTFELRVTNRTKSDFLIDSRFICINGYYEDSMVSLYGREFFGEVYCVEPDFIVIRNNTTTRIPIGIGMYNSTGRFINYFTVRFFILKSSQIGSMSGKINISCFFMGLTFEYKVMLNKKLKDVINQRDFWVDFDHCESDCR